MRFQSRPELPTQHIDEPHIFRRKQVGVLLIERVQAIDTGFRFRFDLGIFAGRDDELAQSFRLVLDSGVLHGVDPR